MGDLARRRNARDLWISRGHLYAVAIAGLVLAGTMFTIGQALGRSAAANASHRRPLISDIPDQALVELLARVESSSDPLGGIELLTFPDDLSRVPVPIVSVGPPLPAELATEIVPELPAPESVPTVLEIPAGLVSAPLISEPMPVGPWVASLISVAGGERAKEAVALRNALQQAGIDARVRSELRNGSPHYAVLLGGFVDEAALRTKVGELGAWVDASQVTIAVRPLDVP